MDIFKLGDKILALLEAVFGFWNNQISLVFAMLGQSPVSFKGGGPWAVIEGIEPVFVAVGSSLVVLFFVIGFCSESIDVKDEMRFESIFRMLIRLGLSEWFVANNVTIMKAFFTSIGNLVGLISAGTTTQLAIDSTQADVIKGLGFGESLVMLILTALLAIIIIMLYDIRYIYMPGGDKIRQWLEESVMIIIKEYDNYILDEFDIVANELAETGNCDKEMFQKQININLDLNDVLVEWAFAICSYEKMNRKVVHYIPIESVDEELLDNNKMILVTPEEYEEYIKLKNSEK